MKESINYYYNLSIAEVEEWETVYRFKLNDSYFYFVPLKRLDTELDDLIKVSVELKRRGIEVHEMIANKFGNLITNVYNQNYIMLKPVGDIYEVYELKDILKMNERLILTTTKSNLYRNSWAKLWSDKLDYFEYQVHELGKDKEIILDSFSYYLGMAENAISYVVNTESKYTLASGDRIVLSHRRINYPNYKLNFCNPLSFIFDLEVRDIASFIKSAFVQEGNPLFYLEQVLKLKKFSIYSLQMLFARLVYPTYYFDIYEKVMSGELDEDRLIPIIDKAQDYEIFLQKAFSEISKYMPIDRIEWLLKKEL